jgi:hypothetical protein
MGLDATVSCNCFKEGRTTQPPIPPDWLYLDDEGYWSCRPEHEAEYSWPEFYRWKQTCCEHEGMNYARERISNWAGYRLFQEALEKIGWDNFPILRSELPSVNGGMMFPEAARQALLELDLFRRAGEIGRNAALIDTRTGFLIFEHVAAYEGVFVYGGRSPMEAGVGERAFFIRERASGNILFRATRIGQKLLDPVHEGQAYEGRVEFRDLDTMQTLVCPIVVPGCPKPWADGRIQNDRGEVRFNPSDGFHVELRMLDPTHFDYAVNPLARVFEASVATGNPVRWC